MAKLIEKGSWGHSTYEIKIDLHGNYKQYISNVTGVFCVCFNQNNELILTKHHKSKKGHYEPLGGHVEPGETILDTLKREAFEEGGVELSKYKYFGFYEINNHKKDQLKRNYPKIGYILFFLAEGKVVSKPTGEEIKYAKIMSIDQFLNMRYRKHTMVKEAIKLFPDYLKN